MGLEPSLEAQARGCEVRCTTGIQLQPSGVLLKAMMNLTLTLTLTLTLLKAMMKRLRGQLAGSKKLQSPPIALHSRPGGLVWGSPGWWAMGDGNTHLAAAVLASHVDALHEDHAEMMEASCQPGVPPGEAGEGTEGTEGDGMPPVVNAIRVHWPYDGIQHPGAWASAQRPTWPRHLALPQDKATGPGYRPHRGGLLGMPLSKELAVVMMVPDDANIPEVKSLLFGETQP